MNPIACNANLEHLWQKNFNAVVWFCIACHETSTAKNPCLRCGMEIDRTVSIFYCPACYDKSKQYHPGIAPPRNKRLALYQHKCGYPLAAVWNDAANTYLLRDDKLGSGTRMEVMDCCPGCGELMSFRASMCDRTLIERGE